VIPQGLLTFASALSATMLNALWEDALLVLCIALLLRLWPQINAATRYTVWCATLAAAIVVPIATTLSFFASPQARVSTSVTNDTPHSAPAGGLQTVHSAPAASRNFAANPVQQSRLPQRLRLTLPVPVAIGVFAAWVILAAYALLRLILGLRRLEQIKRDALPLPVEYRDAMPQWLRANKGTRDVRLCVSDATDVPVAVGLFDSMILVPHSLLDRLSETEVDQICLHELAHLRRGDDWTNGVQRLIVALLGWNPAAQFIGQQLDLEREVACDDWVLSVVGTVRPYALCLTKMAERASWPRDPIPAPGVFATRKHISVRIERLLGAGRNIATNLALAPAAAAIAAVSAIALVIAFVAPSIAAPAVTVISVPPVTVRIPSIAIKVPAHKVSIPKVHVIYETIRVPAVATTPRQHVAEVTIPHVRVPTIDAKPLAESIGKQVSESVSRAFAGQQQVAQAHTNCSGCTFGRVDWSGRDMRGVNYTGVDLSGARLVGTNFGGGNFNGVDFNGADLRNASFRGAHMTGCDFSNANLAGVDFRGSRLSGCDFSRARLGSSELRDVLNSCTGCDFGHTDMRGLDLSHVRANGDDFSGADLRGANFAGADLVGIDFSGARLDGANVTGTTFNGCDLDGVDLSRVDLSRAKMIGTDFSKRGSPP
jgi:uncharacterized protein YjbI with pentapeptide repeats/beta-lactamase regulating signal transducer with metallopeptidase domain